MKEEIDFNKVYSKIQDLLNNGGATISVLEEQIDVELQLDYFNFSKKAIKNLDKDAALNEMDLLNSDDIDLEKKKEILSVLAKIDNPEAYRAIESYREIAEEELKSWTTLALQESKMVLETSLLGKAPIFISTGLGGKGDRLRYFLVFVGQREVEFEVWQQDLVKKELEYELKNKKGEVEDIVFKEDKVLIDFLLPISVNVKDVLTVIVDNCNEFGGFLMKSFIVTNVKKLSDSEIQGMVDEYRGKNLDTKEDSVLEDDNCNEL